MWSTLLLSFLLSVGIQFVHAGKFSLKVASSSSQGHRPTMEDAHSLIFPLTTEEPNSAYFGVFDGHGGQEVALLASENLHKFILNEPEYNANVSKALMNGFMAFDKTVNKFLSQGATANVVIIKDGYLYCANAGDSRAVRSLDGVVGQLSIDHKPKNADETARIDKADGFVYRGSVMGGLAVSRALGDFQFKQKNKLSAEAQMVTALPDVQSFQIPNNLEFVILACDGVWDVMTNKTAVDFVRTRMTRHMEPENICEEILKHCLEIGSTDNMTVILVFFLHDSTYSELCDTVSSNSK